MDFALANIFAPTDVLLRARLYAPDDSTVSDLALVEGADGVYAGTVALGAAPADSEDEGDDYEYEVRQVATQDAAGFDGSTTVIISRGLFGYVIDGAWSDSAPLASPASSSYLTRLEADALAAILPTLTAWSAASSAAKALALEQATLDVDAAGPWQGRRYDAAQALEFPRLPYPSSADPTRYAAPGADCDAVWDWDADEQEAVVPRNVKLAVLHQADAILSGASATLAARQQAIASGLASQSVGGMSESYQAGGGPAGGGGNAAAWGLLTARAQNLLKPYRLRSGRLL